MPPRNTTYVPFPVKGADSDAPPVDPPAPPGSWLEQAQRAFGIDGARFGALMSEAYARRGWSRGELHRRSGVPESTLAAIEKGRIANLNPLTGFAIAWALEFTTPYELLRAGPSEAGDDPWFNALSKEAEAKRPALRAALLKTLVAQVEPGAASTESESDGDAPEAQPRPSAKRRRATRDDDAGAVRARARAKGQTAGAVAVAGGSQAAVGIVVMLGRRLPRVPAGARRPGRRARRPGGPTAEPPGTGPNA